MLLVGIPSRSPCGGSGWAGTTLWVLSGFAPPHRADRDLTTWLVTSGFITTWSPVVLCARRPSFSPRCPA